MNLLSLLRKLFIGTIDVPSPRDLIPQNNIVYLEDKELIVISHIKPKVWLTTVLDTNSMDPLVDAKHTCILISSFKKSDLAVGDIIVYWDGHQDIIHRIIKIDEDEAGRRYKLKGDNCFQADNFIVRDFQIKWLLIGVIY
ncbi:MAG: hypothetical protein Q8L68_04540 [Methylococcales bacterium]|nr:hypothetical protein [Methylococcales bacterium]